MKNTNNPFKYSDHLPAMKKFIINNQILCISTWNVLFEKWLQMNIGPNGDGHIAKYFNHLTTMDFNNRKNGILSTICELLKFVDVLALQEFDGTHLNELNQELKKLGNFQIILPSMINGFDNDQETALTAKGSNDLQLVIYNATKLKHNLASSHLEYYRNKDASKKINKRIMNISFSVSNMEFRFINTHVQFMAIDQLTTYIGNIKKGLQQQYNLPIIVVGDMNQENRSNNFFGSPNDPNLLVYTKTNVFEQLPYTHIDTKGNLVTYDHIWYREI